MQSFTFLQQEKRITRNFSIFQVETFPLLLLMLPWNSLGAAKMNVKYSNNLLLFHVVSRRRCWVELFVLSVHAYNFQPHQQANAVKKFHDVDDFISLIITYRHRSPWSVCWRERDNQSAERTGKLPCTKYKHKTAMQKDTKRNFFIFLIKSFQILFHLTTNLYIHNILCLDHFKTYNSV